MNKLTDKNQINQLSKIRIIEKIDSSVNNKSYIN